jgi:hypothetical protein
MKVLFLFAGLFSFASPLSVAQTPEISVPSGFGKRLVVKIESKLVEDALEAQRSEKRSKSQQAIWEKFHNEINAEVARLTLEEAKREGFNSRRDYILSPKYDKMLDSCFTEMFTDLRTLHPDKKETATLFYARLWWLYRLTTQRDFLPTDEHSQLGETRRVFSEADRQRNQGWFGILVSLGQKLSLPGF